MQMLNCHICEHNEEQTILSALAGMLLTSGHANALLEQWGIIDENRIFISPTDELLQKIPKMELSLCKAVAAHEFSKDIVLATLAAIRDFHLHQAKAEDGNFPQILSYIDKNYTDPSFCCASISEKFDINISTFSRQFKEKTGTKFIDYVHKRRIDLAKKQLEQNCSLRMEDLAECMGYTNTLTFYFACAGREHGSAGYAPGVKPRAVFKPGPPDLSLPEADVCDPMVYTMKDGTQKYGSYFFHFDLNSKPSSRDEAKARAFAGDFIEDYFMTYDGNPNPPYSKIISIS